MIYLGTSGFSYEDWVGPLYPPGLPKRDWLAYYAREFNACEINSTYYALPRPATLEQLARKTGAGFLFAVKAYQGLTHQREGHAELFRSFRSVLEPLIAEAKLGCVLAQFPYSFGPTPPNWDYLRSFHQRLADLPLVIEFRNARWLREEVFSWLAEHDVGFCCVDEPRLPNLLPPLARATSRIAYVRFHGRNAAKWWQHEHAWERYDYSYSAEELAEWVPKVRHLDIVAEKTFVFANNHWRGQAVTTIRQLRTLLD
ncbi:MAG TPA: DUF72 domain-containing protein [Dehalococcoidia bacterium]|nr:DUF72 domain-containing protein [Dehalococcoidia bacterium]